jgi:hypothetical protein
MPPPAGCNRTMITVVAALTLVRPFSFPDATKMVSSFEWWDMYPPCMESGDSSLVMYFSGDATAVRSAMDPVLFSNASWRHCFGSVTLRGADLPPADDVYRKSTELDDWNLGPNLQFHKLLAGAPAPFYYMEADNRPLAAGWFDTLRADVSTAAPFAMIGGRYAGHNWDNWPGIPDDLRLHLNGNAVYNPSHPILQQIAAAFAADRHFRTSRRPSYDVAIARHVLRTVDPDHLHGAGYKASSFFGNFAGTLVVPQMLPAAARVIHGGVFVHGWVDLPDPLPLWYDRPAHHYSAASNLTLVVTEYAPRTLRPFLDQLNQSDASFKDTIVLPFHGGNPWRDFCTAGVQTAWFMWATPDFGVPRRFMLPRDRVGPMNPYTSHDSPFCSTRCRHYIEAERWTHPSFDRHYDQTKVIFNTHIRDGYCQTVGVPSINGYFAFASAAPPTHACGEHVDDPSCALVIGECRRADVVGASVRARCRATCDKCGSRTRRAVEQQPATVWEETAGHTTYSQERYGTVGGFEAPATGVLQNESCTLPFFYLNAEYTACTDEGLCPTSLTNAREFKPNSDNWRICPAYFLTPPTGTITPPIGEVSTTTTLTASLPSELAVAFTIYDDCDAANTGVIEVAVQTMLATIGIPLTSVARIDIACGSIHVVVHFTEITTAVQLTAAIKTAAVPIILNGREVGVVLDADVPTTSSSPLGPAVAPTAKVTPAAIAACIGAIGLTIAEGIQLITTNR